MNTQLKAQQQLKVNDCLSIKKAGQCIKYETVINTPKSKEHLMISHDEVDRYNFAKGFMEVIEGEEYVHLYFDFDTVKDADDIISIDEWLSKLYKVFGDYSYGGYTNDVGVSEEYGLRYIKGSDHYASIHVVFYQTAISTKDLMNIMKHTKNDGYIYSGVHKLCDPNVYKLDSRQ